MKKKLFPVFILLFSLAALIIILPLDSDKQAKRRNFKKFLGYYVIDTILTDFSDYKKDAFLYKSLKVQLKPDSSFVFNMRVPFIYDSIGTWDVAGLDLYDKNTLYFNLNKGIGFFFPIAPYSDTSYNIFFIQVVTPQENQKPLRDIYFKKIQR